MFITQDSSDNVIILSGSGTSGRLAFMTAVRTHGVLLYRKIDFIFRPPSINTIQVHNTLYIKPFRIEYI